jgi:hypothetical protein
MDGENSFLLFAVFDEDGRERERERFRCFFFSCSFVNFV